MPYAIIRTGGRQFRVEPGKTYRFPTLRGDEGGEIEFTDVLLVLPDEASPIMSRELVYTGVTRAIKHVEIWGNRDVFVKAVQARLVRASALQERLWR